MALFPKRATPWTTTAIPWLVCILWLSMGSCVKPDVTAVSGYPAPPEDATEILYVNPMNTNATPSGSDTDPFQTISQALTASESGAAILIAAGIYDETLLVDHPVHLVGGVLGEDGERRVEVAGGEYSVVLKVSFDADPSSESNGDSLVTGQGIAFTGGANAIAVISGDGLTATFEDCSFIGPGTMWDSMTEDKDEKGPYGVVVKGGATLVLERGLVMGARRSGIIAQGAGLSIYGTHIRDNHEGGVRVERALDQVIIHGAAIQENGGFGLGVYSSALYLGETEISDNDAVDADGVVAHPLTGYEELVTAVHAHDNHIMDNGRFGFFLTDTDRYWLTKNTVSGHAEGGIRLKTTPGSQPAPAPADRPLVQGNDIRENTGSGVSVHGPADLVMHCNEILATAAPDEDSKTLGSYGDGISVSGSGEQARVDLRHNQVHDWERFAMFLKDADHSCALGNSEQTLPLCQDIEEGDEIEEGRGQSPSGEAGDDETVALGDEAVQWLGTHSNCPAIWTPPQEPESPIARGGLEPPPGFFSGSGNRPDPNPNDGGPEPPPGGERACGDGTCDADEEAEETCPQDCNLEVGPYCGDGDCNGTEAKDGSCPEDCDGDGETSCGDGICDEDELAEDNCPKDCADTQVGAPPPDQPEYGQNACEEGQEDCNEGTTDVDCDSHDETDDLDDL